MIAQPSLFVIAGPNGAGKTTFARDFLPKYEDCPIFVNVDDLARNIFPREPGAAAIEAGKLMLRQILDLSAHQVSFGFETTLSGKRYLKLFDDLRKVGYKIQLTFLLLPNVEMAVQRVRDRIRQGGHVVPEADIRRRFQRGIQNFRAYRKVVDSWQICDGSRISPSLLAYGTPETREYNDNESKAKVVAVMGEFL